MEQFLAIAAAHFLALLIPGADFFLIARSAMTRGWRTASGACVGIAAAHAIFVTAAFSGLSLISHPAVLSLIQVVGGAFLIYLGIVFIRARVSVELNDQDRSASVGWWPNLGLGLATALLNPKNALFYVSLAAALSTAPSSSPLLYGTWMVLVVLVWDLFIAGALGSERALAKLSRIMPWLTKISGGFLVLFGAGMIIGLAIELIR